MQNSWRNSRTLQVKVMLIDCLKFDKFVSKMKTILNILWVILPQTYFTILLLSSNVFCWISRFQSLTLQLQMITSQLRGWIYGSCTGLGGLPGCLINHCSVWIKTSPEKFHFSGSCGTNKMDMILDYYQYFICLFFLFSYSSHPRPVYPLTTWSKWKH